MMDLGGFVINAIIVLVVMLVLFAIIDRVLKGSTKKSTEKKSEEKPNKPEPKPVIAEDKKVTPVEPQMKIYNSELADDLNEILKKTQVDSSARLKIENHMNKESNVAKYIKSKNYRSFHFEEQDGTNDEQEEQPMSFTVEDYKRIMALSNIDDKK